MSERRTLGHPTLEALLREVVDMTLDGWAISADEPGEANPFGSFTVSMVRSDASVNAFKERAEAVKARPKMTPQERMAHARSQRGKGRVDLTEVVKP